MSKRPLDIEHTIPKPYKFLERARRKKNLRFEDNQEIGSFSYYYCRTRPAFYSMSRFEQKDRLAAGNSIPLFAYGDSQAQIM